jgi:phospholipid-transporting ATPase
MQIYESQNKIFKEDNKNNNCNTKIRTYFGEKNENFYLNKRHGTNQINTTKYNIITFLPKSILLQFKKAANVYFLIVSILTSMDFSPKEASSMIITFSFVLIATMIKELIEDVYRYKQDKISNMKKVLKFNRNGNWEKIECSTLITGDIIKVNKEEEFTSDCIIIKSSSEGGSCFIDTTNLDGESYLKEKCAIEEFKDTSDEDIKYLIGELDYEKPNEIITKWEGILSIGEITIYTNMRNMILKGCTLKNTNFVIGLVIYVGKNTKIMKNSKKPSIKISKILLTMNYLLYTLFAFDIILCLIFAGFSRADNTNQIFKINNLNNDNNQFNYENINNTKKDDNGFNFPNYIISFLTFFVGYSQLIPISLYISLEIIHMFQSLLIYYDNDIFDEILGKPTLSKTSDLIEELGQVEFIFSDKTGTLTQNSMILKKCFVNKKIYGVLKEKEEKDCFTINGDLTASKKILSNFDVDQKDKESLLDFFNLIALCHSVFPEKTDKGIIYQGSSPDDVALVQGAAQMGIEFISKDFNDLKINNRLLNSESSWELIVEMPFDSNRKRMSVIIKNKSTNELFLLSKGADNIMLSDDRINLNQEEYDEIDNVINLFSKEGLRVLVMGMRYVSDDEFEDWQDRLNEARNNGNLLENLYEEIECDMNFVGCSAVEDKLQEGVPETIHSLLSCNIRVWVLTGDKQDTALEIAKSCMLINENMHVLVLSTAPNLVEEKLKQVMRELNLDIYDEMKNINLDEISEYLRENLAKDLSVVIDGATLEIVLNNYELSRIFFCIAIAAKSVVCCRVSPKQKAKVITLTKEYGPWITLAVGDGANDVPMIMEAHIGIGINGKEGTQAVMSSDYAICKFKFLEKLLLVHGRNGYMKISKFICFYFYKNILLVLAEVIFAIYNRFSGQIFFADYLGTLFNAIFTGWPCIFTFLLEKDHNLKICKRFPILYKPGQINYYFNIRKFWSSILFAIIHSIIAFYIPMFLANDVNESKGDGNILNHWQLSTISFTTVILMVNLKLLIMSNFWTIVNLLSTLFAILFYFFVLFILSSESFSYRFQNEVIK